MQELAHEAISFKEIDKVYLVLGKVADNTWS